MISTPTTFVVGAGASCNMKLPTGRELRNQAAGLTGSSNAVRFLKQELHFTGEVLECVLTELRDDVGAGSIDAFLVTRQHRPDVMQIGRALIALLLGQLLVLRRARSAWAAPADDWLGYIIGRMRDRARTCAEFCDGNADVRFVTFNFDPCIEERFERELRVMFPEGPSADIARARKLYAPVHIHGKLPPSPGAGLVYDTFNQPNRDWSPWLKAAVDQVRVVMDDIDPEVIANGRAAVREAKMLCFVGFGYGTENLDRLGFTKDFFTTHHHVSMFGSSQGMFPGERARVEQRLPGIRLNGGCLDVLREEAVLRD